jgi:hypothetical protein
MDRGKLRQVASLLIYKHWNDAEAYPNLAPSGESVVISSPKK